MSVGSHLGGRLKEAAGVRSEVEIVHTMGPTMITLRANKPNSSSQRRL